MSQSVKTSFSQSEEVFYRSHYIKLKVFMENDIDKITKAAKLNGSLTCDTLNLQRPGMYSKIGPV